VPEPADDWRHGGFGIYVHWPFCLHKCPYCDFNSHVRRHVDPAVWAEALTDEIARTAARVPGRDIGSVFFGGGTPSLMPPALVGAILEKIAACWTLAPDAEVTLEANPTSVERGRFRGYRTAGVNRLSLGVQALDDRDLRRLGRMHSVADSMQAIDIARECFDRVSADLIYARQDQGVSAWENELGMMLDLGLDHLSLYQLTIEDGTVFGLRAAAGRLRGLPDTDLAARLFHVTQSLCEAAGLPAYETSNHARPGAEGRHNLVYWRYGDFAGIGPGAHGRLTLGPRRVATRALPDPQDWLSAAAGGGSEAEEMLSRRDQARELVLMGLRLREGISLARLAKLDAAALSPSGRDQLLDQGLVAIDGDRLTATAAGRPVLNAVIRTLLA
jgi:oxygen-independent coproporphyrinogen-3 oxidase